MGLNRNDSTPLYVQLKALLAARIADGFLKPGERLSSERQLCNEFGISRLTVREGLRELEQEGLVRTVPGRGTFVATPQLDLCVNVSLSGFTDEVRRQGLSPSSALLDARLLTVPSDDLTAELVEIMDLQPGDEVAKVERLRLVNDHPFAQHSLHLNHFLCPHILDHDLAHESLFGLLRDEYGLVLHHAIEQVYAALATRREMELLDLSYPSAVLHAERTTLLDTGEVIEFALATYCGDWYRLRMVLEATE